MKKIPSSITFIFFLCILSAFAVLTISLPSSLETDAQGIVNTGTEGQAIILTETASGLKIPLTLSSPKIQSFLKQQAEALGTGVLPVIV